MPSFSVYLSVCNVASSCVAGAGAAAPARGSLVARAKAKPSPDRGAAALGRRRAHRARRTAVAIRSVWLGIAPLTPRWLTDSADHVWSWLSKRRA